MASNQSPDSPNNNSRTAQWVADQYGILDTTQPGYEYVAHDHLEEGPSPAMPFTPTSRPSRRGEFRKLVRDLGRIIAGKPKTKDRGEDVPDAKIIFGPDNLFVPSQDPQLTFRQLPANMNTESPAPREQFKWDEQVADCRECQLCYLVGKAGPRIANAHPHHNATLNEQRSIMVLAHNRFRRQDDEWHVHGRFFYGRRSQHNSEVNVGPFKVRNDALAYSLGECLQQIEEEVLPKRKALLMANDSNAAGTNQLGLEPQTGRLRIVIFTDMHNAPYIHEDGAGYLTAISRIMKRLAEQNVEVKWCDLCPIYSPPGPGPRPVPRA